MNTLTLHRSNATATLHLQGAHLATWELDGKPVLFLSPRAVFESGKAIRGGIPVCFPWFNAHATNPDLPSHGFARTSVWTLKESAGDCAVLELESNEKTLAMWPHAFVVTYRLQLLKKGLLMDFRVQNTGEFPFTFETALHSYFALGDVQQASVEGLDGKTYLDQTEGFRRKVQQGDLVFAEETDRLFVDSPGPLTLREGARVIRLTGLEGWKSTIVWNPWTEKARALKDLGEDQWPYFACVETGFAADDAVTLPAGETWRLAVEIEVE
ncbi:D-hexose-6-phosphate mutarotase [Verrucomicrobium sp. BvORR106]|uniref:D-hexose-6-phosphate mutarotase n=1 Tax=Verrucomicrobium sp. BvORR106 TaxID=1403819 RepID=UPI0006895EA8|nr:D-hexose-6-phosphate mutarotase [Verrucomicrobium sp. BvORR106]